MSFLSMVLSFVLIFAAVWLVFTFGRKFVFSKVRINKFIPLGIAIAGLLAQLFLKPTNPVLNIGLTIVTVAFFMWFMDIQITGGPKKQEKEIVIKPKAKPNRVKHLNKDNK